MGHGSGMFFKMTAVIFSTLASSFDAESEAASSDVEKSKQEDDGLAADMEQINIKLWRNE
jgi:hypothetical protein